MSSAQPLAIDTTSNAQATAGCFHCGLPVPRNQKFEQPIDGVLRQFCCPACQMVCNTIYDAGLQGFYDRTPQGTPLAPPPEPPEDLALYDLDEVQAEFVPSLDNEREIHLLVEGIHCAACIWLIERALGRTPGVLAVQVNLSNKRLKLRWDNRHIKLSQVMSQLADIGYAAVPYDPEVAEGRIKKQNRAMLFRMAFAGFAMMNLLWVSVALYSGAAASEFRSLFQWIGFALATPTLFYSGYPFLRGAWTGLRRMHLTMDLPIAIGALTTYGYSLYITLSQSAMGEVYYDTVVNFMFVILVGRYLEAMSKRQAISSTQRLLDLQPRGATVLRDGETVLLPIRAVALGERVLVRPGDKIPVDGEVVEGRSKVNEAMLSGEAHPVSKQPGDRVSAGTINLDSALTISVTGTLKDTALGRIIHLVEEAQASKAPIQCVADRIVPWFVAATLMLSAITFIWWLSSDFERALMAATAVLIITCPCAFGLATPMAIASASGLGARHGILIKNGAVLETLSHINHFVFDKTGTLTQGQMQVSEVLTDSRHNENQLLERVAAVERYSEHSIAKAIAAAAKAKNLLVPAAQENHNLPGYGVKGTVNGTQVVAGTVKWLREHDIELNADFVRTAEHWETQGRTCVHVGIAGCHAGLISIADQLRDDANALVRDLRAAGVRLTLLSGDRRAVAETVARQLGGMEVIAEVLPEDKDKVIRQLQQHGAQVAMVGDGVNDAPALIRANVGIALGSGTDVSGDSADIVLMSNELHKVSLASQLSRRTLRTIRQNIAISITYNIVMVPLAMAAFITPLVAAISMPISSLLVIGNAARIRTMFKKEDRHWK
ncbi:MAG: heavy metal translocating P-type ATPase [Gammaproteobacteria bacterium]|nr:heavy metal translocating P-type ATPase [Gammaproteobacteria bacterium]